MRLTLLKYSEYQGEDLEWTLDRLTLGQINLIVGKNSSGKSRTLNVISALAMQLAGKRGPSLSGMYEATFLKEGKELVYEVSYTEGNIVRERFSKGGDVLLERGSGGEGLIWAEEINGGGRVKFQSPPDQFAAVSRRDGIQHPFLEPLHTWAQSVRIYRFGTALGKDKLAMIVPALGTMPDAQDQDATIGLFRQGVKKFGAKFEAAILEDLASVGYDIERVDVGPMVSIKVQAAGPSEIVGLRVKEKSLKQVTDQHSMSQGMFRALALFIHVNYGYFTETASCILIDDIGEGLDFSRSCRVIERLRERAKHSDVQLILTTNDRFVMNSVPLDEWSILQRTGGRVVARNRENSLARFEEFKFTGLSNFSFFEMDLINEEVTKKNEETGNLH